MGKVGRRETLTLQFLELTDIKQGGSMKILKADGNIIDVDERLEDGIWVRWVDIKPIIEEYQETIENESIDMNFYENRDL
jgi:hypothetical protein